MLNNLAGVISGFTKSTYSQTILADSPVGFWLTNETSGSTATDSTANANNLSYVASPTLNVSTGLSGVTKAVTYNGSTQYANSAKVATFNMSANANWSVEGWFKTTTSAFGTVLMFRDNLSGSNAEMGGGIFINLTANKISAFSTDSALSNLVITSSTSVNTGAWFYACVTAASGGAMTLYINGASEGSTSTARGSTAGNKYFSTAAQAGLAGAFQSLYTGSTAALAIYNTTLTSTQVLAHYNAGI